MLPELRYGGCIFESNFYAHRGHFILQKTLGTHHLLIGQIDVEEDRISIEIERDVSKAICPKCHQESTSIHSCYMRYPTDLAWAGRAVTLNYKVKRFFCRNQACSKRTFAEQFPEIIVPYARRTNRVSERQKHFGVNTCARTAEKLLEVEQIGVSDSTINRLVRALPEPQVQPIRVLGVDDWAKRKGQRYGTILVDLERAQVIDLLDDRTADTLVKWLKEHPGIEIVSRDRSQTYADAITEGIPAAMQVADRWHLLKNLSDAVFKVMQQEYTSIKAQLDQLFESEQAIPIEIETLRQPETLTISEEKRREHMKMAQHWSSQGWTQKDIAKHLDLHPKTIRRYLHSASPRSRRPRGSHLLDPFKPYLIRRWNNGCHNAAKLYQ